MKKFFKYKIIEIILILILPIMFSFMTVIRANEIISNSRKNTFINIAKTIVAVAENMHINNKNTGIYSEINCENIMKLDNNYSYCSIYIDNDDVRVTLKGNNKFNGMNICSEKKDNITINGSCDNKCFNSDIIDVNKPYKIKDYKSCIKYTKNIFMNDLSYTDEKVELVCKGENDFELSINKLLNLGIEEEELVRNKVIEGNINNVCIPTEIKKNCFSFKIYTEKDSKYAEITGYDDTCGNEPVVPNTVMGIPVESIGEYAFHQKKINRITFPNTIKYIKTGALQGHGDGVNSTLHGGFLTGTLDLSNLVNLKKIDYFAFADNGINKVIFPNNLKEIGSYAFSGNSITGELDLSNTKLSRVDSYVFSSSNITSIKLPISIESIAFTAFASNDISGELDLSNYTKLKVIEEDAFANNKITNIKLPISINNIKRMAFYNNNITGTLDFSINENLVTIGENAFENNNIENVILPLSIKNISNNAFLKNDISNPNLIKVINPTDIDFDWKEIIMNIEEDFDVINEIKT